VPEGHAPKSARRRGRLVPLSLASGVVWGGIALGLGYGWMHQRVWGGVLVAPLIGLAVGIAARGFDRRPGWLRALHALAALYIAAALFGLAVGVADLVLLDAPGRRPFAVVLQSVHAVLWGLTFTGYVLLLGPLSYANHALVARAARPRDA
jgi:hypothetical protein